MVINNIPLQLSPSELSHLAARGLLWEKVVQGENVTGRKYTGGNGTRKKCTGRNWYRDKKKLKSEKMYRENMSWENIKGKMVQG